MSKLAEHKLQVLESIADICEEIAHQVQMNDYIKANGAVKSLEAVLEAYRSVSKV